MSGVYFLTSNNPQITSCFLCLGLNICDPYFKRSENDELALYKDIQKLKKNNKLDFVNPTYSSKIRPRATFTMFMRSPNLLMI